MFVHYVVESQVLLLLADTRACNLLSCLWNGRKKFLSYSWAKRLAESLLSIEFSQPVNKNFVQGVACWFSICLARIMAKLCLVDYSSILQISSSFFSLSPVKLQKPNKQTEYTPSPKVLVSRKAPWIAFFFFLLSSTEGCFTLFSIHLRHKIILSGFSFGPSGTKKFSTCCLRFTLIQLSHQISLPREQDNRTQTIHIIEKKGYMQH